jgi:Methyltransferase domain
VGAARSHFRGHVRGSEHSVYKVTATLQDVLRDQPALHGEAGATELTTYGLLEDALAYLERTVQPGDRTLETGSGLSTITFALRGARHTCIVPYQAEVDRIEAYCRGRGISTDELNFVLAPSERVLPGLELDPLDVVLIDGSHSFPQVFIDWFFVAGPLKIGGALLVDDVHLWTGRTLRDFLTAEPEWELVDELGGRTAIFRKVADVDPDKIWTEQRYVVKQSHLGLASMARMSASMLRRGQVRQLAAAARTAVGTRLGRLVNGARER